MLAFFKKQQLIAVTGFLLCTGCLPAKTLQFGKTVCDQQRAMDIFLPAPTQPYVDAYPDTALAARFSEGDRNAAYAIGLLQPLSDYIVARKACDKEASLENRLRILELSTQISRRIALASMEISAVSSELDCEEEKLTQIADYMREKETKKETRLTVLSIAVAAAGELIPLLLSSGQTRADNAVTIVSSTAGATLGALILTNERKVSVPHPRNALRDVWEGKAHTDVFPPLVWYYLNNVNLAAPDDRSLRERLLQRWQRFGQIKEPAKKEKQKLLRLYFGDGGEYTTSELYNRAGMYDQLESYIRLINQDLTHLGVAFEKIR